MTNQDTGGSADGTQGDRETAYAPSHMGAIDNRPGTVVELHGFAPAFGLPSPGPFAIKTEVQLRMLGLPYRLVAGSRDLAPKGRLPYIVDGGVVVADSSFIRFHLEASRGLDLDLGFDESERALAWCVERMVEDNLYWTIVHARWAIDESFEAGPAHLFDALPADLRDAARNRQRAAVLGYLHGQGTGRHSFQEVAEIARHGFAALARLMGDRTFLLGDRPCGADASIFGQIASALAPRLDTPVRAIVESHPNLVAFRDRMMQLHYPAYA